MKVGLKGSYIEYVEYMGINDNYPDWFNEVLYDCITSDENRFTFYVPKDNRKPDYHEKALVEDYSVFLRKPNGDIHLTDYDAFRETYTIFRFDAFTNSGIAAFTPDTIEYVECQPGYLNTGYPDWFYEYFTESITFPGYQETIFLYDDTQHKLIADKSSLFDSSNGQVSVITHCVFLKNKYGEIKGMDYDTFLKYYDPDPDIGRWYLEENDEIK